MILLWIHFPTSLASPPNTFCTKIVGRAEITETQEAEASIQALVGGKDKMFSPEDKVGATHLGWRQLIKTLASAFVLKP